jgi:plastocyanin
LLAEVCIRVTSGAFGRAAVRLALLLALAIAAIASGAASAGGPNGRVVGRVRLVAAIAARPLATSYSSRTIVPQGDPPREIKNVVVSLLGMPATAVPPRHYQLRQEGELFLPHVLAIARGSLVDFTNDDPFYHNVFSLSRAGTFDLGRFPRGQSRTRDFNQAGLVKVFCHLHSDMSAVLVVFDHPWFTTPEDDGTFVLANVPPGRHTVAAWHERVGEARRAVDVPAGGDATVEFELPVVEP